jgi:hypothetical protein
MQQGLIHDVVWGDIQYYSIYGSIIGIIGCSILRILDCRVTNTTTSIPIILGYTYGSIGGLLLVWILIKA